MKTILINPFRHIAGGRSLLLGVLILLATAVVGFYSHTGPFYVNRKDPRLIVPKLNPSMGWTFNFASPYSYLLIIAVILIIVFSQYFI